LLRFCGPTPRHRPGETIRFRNLPQSELFLIEPSSPTDALRAATGNGLAAANLLFLPVSRRENAI